MTRRFVLLLVLLPLSSVWSQTAVEPLGKKEGYLLVGIEVTGGGEYDSINIDRPGTMGTAHYFKQDEIEAGMNFKLIPLKAGTYFFDRINLPYNWVLRMDKEAYEMTVEPGVINYGGTLYAEIFHNDAGAYMRNRATEAIQHLAECCGDLMQQYPVKVSRADADPFIEYLHGMKDGPLYTSGAVNASAEPEVATDESESEAAEVDPADEIRDAFTYALFRRSNVGNARLSPDGSMVAYFDAPDNQRRLVVVHLEQARKLVLMNELNNVRLERIFWIDNKRVAFEYDNSRTEGVALATLKFDDGQLASRSLSTVGNDIDIVDPLPNLDKLAVIYGYTAADLGSRDRERVLRKIDITDPKSSDHGWDVRVEKKLDTSWGWKFAQDGDVRLLVNREPRSDVTESLMWEKDNRKWHRIWVHTPRTVFVPLIVADGGDSVIALSDAATDNVVLAKFAVDGGKLVEVLHSVPGIDIENATTNPQRDRIISVGYVKDGIFQYDYLESAEDLQRASMDSELVGQDAVVLDLSFDETTALVRTRRSNDPGEVFALDIPSGEWTRVGSVRPWVGDYRLGSSQTIRSVSTDGETVESYLTLPAGNGDSLPPLVVMPHGGPIAVRDTRHFDDLAQFLAVFGYAVLQTNYRGSSGFGKAFREKGEGQWGRLIEDDIESAVEEVIAQQFVDGDRVCIFGASYGGYSALISAVRRPDLYKCAASFAGVTDLPLLFHRWSLTFQDDVRDLLTEIVGDPETDIETLKRFSPTFLASQIDIPVLLVQGAKDERVDIEHYYRMKLMLEHYGKDAEFIVMPEAGHGFTRVSQYQDLLRSVDDFLRQSLGLEFPSDEQILTPAGIEKRRAEAEEARKAEEAQEAEEAGEAETTRQR